MTARTRRAGGAGFTATALLASLLAGGAAASTPAASGDPDPTFGDDGFVEVLSPDPTWPTIRDLSGNPKRDGGAALAGTLTRPDSFLTRPYAAVLLPDGSYDEAFSADGVVYPTLPGWPDEDFTKYADEALPHTGGVLVAGHAYDEEADGRTRLWLEKYGRLGGVDRDFAQNGRFRVRNLDFSIWRDVTVAPDDSILICATSPRETKLTVIRLDAEGMAVPGFGTDGRVSVAIKDHGGVKSCAVNDAGLVTIASRQSGQFWLTRLTPAGELDSSFGDDGFIRENINSPQSVGDAVVQPSGKSWFLVNDYTDATVMKRRANGGVDTSFGNGGSASVEMADDDADPNGNDLEIGPAGSVVVAGSIYGREVGGEPFVARLLSDGSMDAAFGDAGVSNFFELIENFWEVDVYPDGRVLVEGFALDGPAYAYTRLLD